MYTLIEGKKRVGNYYASDYMNDRSRERMAIEEGFLAASDIIGMTYGPGGSNAIIAIADGPGAGNYRPMSTNDGVTVSRNIHFEDAKMATGARMLLSACEATVAAAGDGTTLTAILSQSFLTALNRMKEGKGSRKGLVEKVSGAIIAALEKTVDAIRVPANESVLASVAYVSMKGNKDVAKGIAKAVWDAGLSGHITLDRGGVKEGVSVETVEGYSWDWGFITNTMYPGNNPLNTVVMDKPIILLVEDKIDTLAQARELIEAISTHFPKGANGFENQFLIVASDVSGAALESFVSTVGAYFRGEGGMPIAAVKAPGYGEERFQYLEDLKVAIGANAIVYRQGGYSIDKLRKNTGKETFGAAKRVTVVRGKTTIEFLPEQYAAIQAHLKTLKAPLRLADVPDEYEHRRAKLSGGIIKVCVSHPLKHVEDVLFMAVEDAVGATTNALRTGAVPGAAYATRHLAHVINTDVHIGKLLTKLQREALKDALSVPSIRLYGNYYEDTKAFAASKHLPIACGVHDLEEDIFYDPKEAPIMDSCASFEHSVRNALHAAGNLFTTGISISLYTKE
jgi:chaperonin GroEL